MVFEPFESGTIRLYRSSTIWVPTCGGDCSLCMHFPSANRDFWGGCKPLGHRVHTCTDVFGWAFSHALWFLSGLFTMYHYQTCLGIMFQLSFYPVQLTYVGCLSNRGSRCSLIYIWFLWHGSYSCLVFPLLSLLWPLLSLFIIDASYYILYICPPTRFRNLTMPWSVGTKPYKPLAEAIPEDMSAKWCADDVVWCRSVLHERVVSWYLFWIHSFRLHVLDVYLLYASVFVMAL